MNWQFFERLANQRTRATTRCVGLVLAIRAKRDDPKCDPSIKGICKYAAVGTATATKAIHELESLGLIRVARSFGKRSIYHLTVSDGEMPTVSPGEMPTVSEQEKVSKTPDRFTRRNGRAGTVSDGETLKGATFSHVETQPFHPVKSKGNNSKPSPEQENISGEHDGSEVPY